MFILKTQNHPSIQLATTEWAVPERGGVVGRAFTSDWVLQDPCKIVSRQHAKVTVENRRCVWTDLGVNPTSLNGQPLVPGQPVVLHPGDQLAIGDYLISVIERNQDWFELNPHGQQQDNSGLDFLNPDTLPGSIDELLQGGQPTINDMLKSAADPGVPVLARRMRVACSTRPISDTGIQPDPALAKIHHLLSVSLSGYMRLLQARRLFKQEAGSPMTMLSAAGNNPLKVCASVEEALLLLLDDNSGNYLPAVQAIEQACEDVLSHMQTSIVEIQGLIERAHTLLSPQEIEQEARQANSFGLGLSNARKARMWEVYCQRYALLDKKWS